MADIILVLNAGSSSIKFSVFDTTGGGLELLLRGQIEGLYTAARFGATDRQGASVGAKVDGPLALDNAIDPEAAAIKKIDSPVAGRANVLMVPDLEAGNMLAKSLSFLAGADAAGIVLGARVPIILTSRADEEMARLASCAVAQLLVASRRADASSAVQ